MANRWTINEDKPDKLDNEWHAPNLDQEHVSDTTAPGDLNIKPKDISLKPTLAPKRSGVQHGQVDWNYESQPDSNWYLIGFIED